MKYILGVRFGHDASACLLRNGKIVSDVAEERFTRKKNDGSFPVNAIDYCLKSEGITSQDIDCIAVPARKVHDDFFLFFPGLAKPVAPAAPKSFRSVVKGVLKRETPDTVKADDLALYLKRFPVRGDCRLVAVRHHLAHAASAYYAAGLPKGDKALVMVMDGIGDGESVSIWRGKDNVLEKLASWGSEASLGWFYSAATEAMGWRHSSDEWKLMGLAPYGKPLPGLFDGLFPVFEAGQLVRQADFGNVGRYPDHGTHHYHLGKAAAFKELLDTVSREDFAHEVQRVTEEQAYNIILPWLEREGTRTLCCAGGFFLNVKLNGKLWNSGKIGEHFIYPNPGDSGLAAGACLYAYHQAEPEQPTTKLEHLYAGPEFGNDDIERCLKTRRIAYTRPENIFETTARLLADNRIVGWFQGRMEAGPRALGNRSILMSPLLAENKDTINASVKYREAFRPFCPSLLEERQGDYLVNPRNEPYMITAFDVTEDKKDKIPAVVHVDGSLRPQTVRRDLNPRYHALIKAFGDVTGEYILLNTSFNVMGEPIVCTPSQAVKCFFDSGLDHLVLGDFLISKTGE